ncbi:MAG: hypothetical protein ACPLZH_01300, partial [Minisyncoccales bacterium]
GSLSNRFLLSSLKIMAENLKPKRKTLIIELKEKELREKELLKPAGFLNQLSLSFNDPFSFSFLLSFSFSLLREIYFDFREKIKELFFKNRAAKRIRNLFLNLKLFFHYLLNKSKIKKR